MKRLQIIVIVALLCHVTDTFSQSTINIIEQATDKNNNPVFFTINKNNNKAINEQTEKTFLKELYNADENIEFNFVKEEREDGGLVARCYQQYYKGLRVIGGSTVVHSSNGDIEYVNGTYANNLRIDLTPVLNERLLTDYIFSAIRSTNEIDSKSELDVQINTKDKELVICKDFISGTENYCLAYKVYVTSKKPFLRNEYYIDAITGKLLTIANLVCNANSNGTAQTVYSGTKSIITDSYNSQYRLREVRQGVNIITMNLNHGLEWDVSTMATDITDNNNNWTNSELPVLDIALDAHWAAEKVFDYWKTVHNRNSLDNNGMDIKTFVNYGDYGYFDNAGWFGYLGYPLVGYGEGSYVFKYKLAALDIVAHELGHGVCQYSTTLYPLWGESGALAEALSDIWGATIENWAMPNSPPKSKWLIGEEVTNITPNYLRSMSNPNVSRVPSPDTYLGTYWNTPPYAGDPHKHCTVIDYWFYLLSDGSGGNKTNDVGNVYNVTAIGIDKAARISYEMMKFPLSTYADFFEARAVSIWKARQLYGNGCKGSAEEIAVTKAWYAVNVGPDYNSNPPYTLDGNNSNCASNQCNLYTLSGVPTSGATINWTLTQTPSNTVTGTNNGNGSYTICRNGNANGLVTITAQIIFGQCTTSISKNVNVGIPYVLFPYQGTTYPIASMEDCNITCYSPSQYSFYSTSDPFNGTVTWQKEASIPANVAWSGYNNYVKVLLKAPNHTITLRRIISNACGSIEETYCFLAGNSLCTSLRQAPTPTIAQRLKVYPNPTSNNNALSLELSTDDGTAIDFENSSIQLVDAQNVIIVQKSGSKIVKEKLEIPVLSKGVYYIRVTNKNGVSTKQIIINN